MLNPAEPPLVMRDTVLCLNDEVAADEVVVSVDMVGAVSKYVPGLATE